MRYKKEPQTLGELVSAVFVLLRDPSAAGRWFLGSTAVLIGSFLFVMYKLFTEGHASFNTSSDGVNWGMPIAVYVFLALTSSGLTMIASLATVFGFKQFYPIAKRCIFLAIVTLLAGFSVLALELGHPFRMLWTIPTGMQVMSPMFWMGVFYTVDLVLLVVKFYLMWKDDWDSPLSHLAGNIGFVAVILASGMLGLVFGSMAMRPMWFGSFTAIYYMLSAALSGAAAIVLTTYIAYEFNRDAMPAQLKAFASGNELPKVFATLIGITLAMMVMRFFTGLWTNADGFEGFVSLAKDPLVQLELWVGLVLPFFLMLSPNAGRNQQSQIVSAVLVLGALLINRYEFIVSGQLVPMFKGNWVSSLIPYTPSLTEWALLVLGISMSLALYAFGEKVLDLSASPDVKEEIPAAGAKVSA